MLENKKYKKQLEMLEKQKYLEKKNGEIEIFKKNEMLTKQKYLKEMEMEKQKY